MGNAWQNYFRADQRDLREVLFPQILQINAEMRSKRQGKSFWISPDKLDGKLSEKKVLICHDDKNKKNV